MAILAQDFLRTYESSYFIAEWSAMERTAEVSHKVRDDSFAFVEGEKNAFYYLTVGETVQRQSVQDALAYRAFTSTSFLGITPVAARILTPWADISIPQAQALVDAVEIINCQAYDGEGYTFGQRYRTYADAGRRYHSRTRVTGRFALLRTAART